MTSSPRGILLLGTALCAGMASAQETADPYFLGTLRIGTQAAQNLLGNDKITEEEIEERNPTTMADVFKGESSVTTSGGAAIAQ
ncbi:hypothetical protein QO034_19890 [Sedimentitalea sp. JM2-8]|uniref:Uncharacterized protein n=1 Tax=Sedimentitalea xiamensis TaxID=3050037 RepID=A0ABT7FJY6_9RHOB|nr:hypothetical protein [Sedimentitalea xiamensis]MDK3075345.1 hypothetical protein [Sedimentitalea xiamensis]